MREAASRRLEMSERLPDAKSTIIMEALNRTLTKGPSETPLPHGRRSLRRVKAVNGPFVNLRRQGLS
ncbi:hypothetical protein NDU88_001400 [Pleurodeles waltl]|uniref:Uncharacterized protein n=1 Tax=Pleurodeles waltl TaxID=8319 RepID=A0AAV7U7T1_PLEWA|nr:hypothetical protein NDU88_001400 [Pleurodeles waltl]